ncbi:MAG: DUF378 domain-containing protein [Candidatus Margulisbacteria bacterium]|nr:DUF378 domain-containing protein [Candidatus Margulisiibacteriota bacterium]
MKALNLIALILVIVGALNWGLVGLLEVNLVQAICGSVPGLTRAVYALVGLAGVYVAVIAPKIMK